ncbi:hypothetical protein GCM10007858_28350 [Bradyrhizobium liaoningense]|nr:hypothetical protein GCM10007858_28350 [Bradyrhizobium liaoningense]
MITGAIAVPIVLELNCCNIWCSNTLPKIKDAKQSTEAVKLRVTSITIDVAPNAIIGRAIRSDRKNAE